MNHIVRDSTIGLGVMLVMACGAERCHADCVDDPASCMNVGSHVGNVVIPELMPDFQNSYELGIGLANTGSYNDAVNLLDQYNVPTEHREAILNAVGWTTSAVTPIDQTYDIQVVGGMATPIPISTGISQTDTLRWMPGELHNGNPVYERVDASGEVIGQMVPIDGAWLSIRQDGGYDKLGWSNGDVHNFETGIATNARGTVIPLPDEPDLIATPVNTASLNLPTANSQPLIVGIPNTEPQRSAVMGGTYAGEPNAGSGVMNVGGNLQFTVNPGSSVTVPFYGEVRNTSDAPVSFLVNPSSGEGNVWDLVRSEQLQVVIPAGASPGFIHGIGTVGSNSDRPVPITPETAGTLALNGAITVPGATNQFYDVSGAEGRSVVVPWIGTVQVTTNEPVTIAVGSSLSDTNIPELAARGAVSASWVVPIVHPIEGGPDIPPRDVNQRQ